MKSLYNLIFLVALSACNSRTNIPFPEKVLSYNIEKGSWIQIEKNKITNYSFTMFMPNGKLYVDAKSADYRGKDLNGDNIIDPAKIRYICNNDTGSDGVVNVVLTAGNTKVIENQCGIDVKTLVHNIEEILIETHKILNL